MIDTTQVLNKEEMTEAITAAREESSTCSPEYLVRIKLYAQRQILKAAQSGCRKVTIQQGEYRPVAFAALNRWMSDELGMEVFYTAGNTSLTVYF